MVNSELPDRLYGGVAVKRIVVGIDGSKESFESYKRAVEYFPEEDIDLEAVFVLDERKLQLPFIYSGAAYDIAYERLYIPVSKDMVALNEQLNKDLSDFGERCLNICRGIDFNSNVSRKFALLRGDPSEELLEFSLDSDLIVVGQHGENSSYKREMIGSTAEEIIRKSRLPVLVIPEKSLSTGNHLIVYEGGSSSEIALDYYINNLVNPEKSVVILISSKHEDIRHKLDQQLKPLRSRGIEIVIKESKGHLVKYVKDLEVEKDIDLIVLGAHGRQKITEYLLGSETAHIVRKSSVPVFIIH